MVHIVDVNEEVWGKKKALDKEVSDVIKSAKLWNFDETKRVEFDKPQKSFRSILKKEFQKKKQVKAKMIDNDPRKWFVMLVRVRRPRTNKIGSNKLMSSALA